MAVPMYMSPISVRRVTLIQVMTMRGADSPENPGRMVTYYYDDNGELVACYDPINGPPDCFLETRPPRNDTHKGEF